ncbi:MAG TPA: hypothetical protein VFL93_16175 [Longimicrobiaceae bacterium]|nr:hypothetical protein [Longimicrobiaceae bacterium]
MSAEPHSVPRPPRRTVAASPAGSPAAAPRPAAPPAAPFPAGGGLVSKSAPPLRLPGEHFAAALGFWLLGALGLVWAAPQIAQGAFPLPRVVAITHLFTLGWITTTIQGALYQFLPVALQVPVRSERLAHLTYGLYVPGVLLFVGGMLVGLHPVLLAGAALFGTALLLFAGNLVATLRRAPERNLTWWALAAAALFLVTTVALGVTLAGNLRWNYLGGHRFLTLAVHLHVALAGWVMMVIVGVAHRLLPMFLLSHGASDRPSKVSLALLAVGVVLLLALEHAYSPALAWTAAAVLGAGALCFVAQAALFFEHRKKPALDPGLRLAGVAIALLVVALVLAPFFLAHGLAAPRIATAYVLTMVGALSLFVAGLYYKILPFLIWYHQFGPLVGKRPVPRVVDLYAARPGNAALVLLAAGVLGLAAATLAGATLAARPAAALFAVGAVIVAAQMFTISRRRPE